MSAIDRESQKAHEDRNRESILEATRRCLVRYGPAKTGVADVAREAGISRPTIYRYFESRDELVNAAFGRAAEQLVERAQARLRELDEPAAMLVEGALFIIRELPADPLLGVLVSRDELGGIPPFNFVSPFSILMTRRAMSPVEDLHLPLSEQSLDELAEIALRILVSLLTMPGPAPRTEEELREFLDSWIGPAVQVRLAAVDQGGLS